MAWLGPTMGAVTTGCINTQASATCAIGIPRASATFCTTSTMGRSPSMSNGPADGIRIEALGVFAPWPANLSLLASRYADVIDTCPGSQRGDRS